MLDPSIPNEFWNWALVALAILVIFVSGAASGGGRQSKQRPRPTTVGKSGNARGINGFPDW